MKETGTHYYQAMWEPAQNSMVHIPAEEADARVEETPIATTPYEEPAANPAPASERVQQTLWLGDRGLVVMLPPKATEKVAHGVNNGGIPKEELQRLKIMASDTILKNRYPTAEEGSKYMDEVDIAWRERLFGIAQQTSAHIVTHAQDMGKKDFAVVLFGSVAKGLTKSPNHPDPSNIDMAVIGDFTAEERDELFDRIRPYRKEQEGKVGNKVGVHIQHTEIFGKNRYNEALNYIASGATALYDPEGVWERIELQALQASETMKKYQTVSHTRVVNESGSLFEKKSVNGEEKVIFRRIPQKAAAAAGEVR